LTSISELFGQVTHFSYVYSSGLVHSYTVALWEVSMERLQTLSVCVVHIVHKNTLLFSVEH